ncbi:hypothetical protein [Paenibacillus alba]|uniref:DUF3923 family protein n=1 Tax=Paenibacillus alba TaxID=1197127 RepID=A0ABU6GFH9_9BACL|nr:hypothetical protein [Paenibacillus alba]MEC0231429.1 hypothetical protein [Paenibacillus alba]
MKRSYTIGYMFVCIWLVSVIYGFITYNEVQDDLRMFWTIWIMFLGLIIFPVYFVLIYLLGKKAR